MPGNYYTPAHNKRHSSVGYHSNITQTKPAAAADLLYQRSWARTIKMKYEYTFRRPDNMRMWVFLAAPELERRENNIIKFIQGGRIRIRWGRCDKSCTCYTLAQLKTTHSLPLSVSQSQLASRPPALLPV